MTVRDGRAELKDQLRDYKYRGEELERMNYLDFMLETYEGLMGDEDEEDAATTSRGRPPNERIAYQDAAGKGKRCRVIRTAEHETLPRFVGRWFARSDKANEKELFQASMLSLLKPWRTLADIKHGHSTFEEAYNEFYNQTDKRMKRVIENIQYYHECSDNAKLHRMKTASWNEDNSTGPRNGFEIGEQELDEEGEQDTPPTTTEEWTETITEEDVQRAQEMRTTARDTLYGENAVYIGYETGFFQEAGDQAKYAIEGRDIQPQEIDMIKTWETQLKATTRQQLAEYGTVQLNAPEQIDPAIQMATSSIQAEVTQSTNNQSDGDTAACLHRTELAKLNEEQKRAHDIIERTLKEHIESERKHYRSM